MAFSFMLLATAASAKVCKVVGPDGSVTFTDRPSAECPVARPASAPITAPAATPPQAAAVAGGRSGAAEPKAATAAPRATDAASAPPRTVDKAVEASVIGILGLEDMVVRARDLCSRTLPTSMRRFDAFESQWRNKNAGAVSAARRALAKNFDASQQQLITTAIGAKNQSTLAAHEAAPQWSRIKWCDQTVAEVTAGKLDVGATLTGPLAAY